MADLTRLGAGVLRAAQTVLRGAGGQLVMLRLPIPAVPGVLGEQLGVPTATFSDEELAPVVLRSLGGGGDSGGMRWELLVGAATVAELAGDGSVTGALALFAQAVGVVVGDQLFQITSVSHRAVGAAVYLYRLELRETIGATT